MAYTYILKCCDGTFYTGWTKDLDNRLKAHNSGQASKYTRVRLPVNIIYYEYFESDNDAMKREAAIKKFTRKEKEELIKLSKNISDRSNDMDKYYLNKEETVLVIIDIQEKLVPVMSLGEKVIKNTNVLISTAQNMEIPIIVTEQYPKGLGNTVPQLGANLEGAMKFEKNTFSGCIEGVLDYLNKTGRKKVIITGMETHVCVFQSVRDLLKQGYYVFVAADAVCSRADENYNNALSLMREMGAVISNTETILFDLLKEAGTPQFKILSKLIK